MKNSFVFLQGVSVGDAFFSRKAVARAEWYMARWQCKIVDINEMLDEEEQ